MSEASVHPTTAVQTRTLDCGTVLLIEPNPSVRTTALVWWLPAGAALDPPGEGADGLAVMCAEMLERGAGTLDSRAFNDSLDRMGVIRDISLHAVATRLSASCRSKQLEGALELLVDQVRRPLMPEDALEPVRSLCLQAIDGLQDDPSALAGLAMSRRALPAPLNRSSYGNTEVIKQVDLETIRATWAQRARPHGSIIAIAGNVDPDRIADHLSGLLDGWEGAPPEIGALSEPIGGVEHVEHASAQVHLEMGFDSPKAGDPEEWAFLAAVRTLGSGASSRLFESVRERRSLCYDVHANYAPGKYVGLCTIGSGTTPDRADETVECIFEELKRFGDDGLEKAEFERVRRGFKTQLMMHGESTSARSFALAHDYYQRGHVRTLASLAESIDTLTFEEVDEVARNRMNASWRDDPVRVAVGPKSPFPS